MRVGRWRKSDGVYDTIEGYVVELEGTLLEYMAFFMLNQSRNEPCVYTMANEVLRKSSAGLYRKVKREGRAYPGQNSRSVSPPPPPPPPPFSFNDNDHTPSPIPSIVNTLLIVVIIYIYKE